MSGYNPDALLNVCYRSQTLTTVSVPSVTPSETDVCPIGQICVPVPIPTLGPGQTHVVPEPELSYLEANGIALYDTDDPPEPRPFRPRLDCDLPETELLIQQVRDFAICTLYGEEA